MGVEQLLGRNVKRFQGGLVFKAHRLVYHSTLVWRVIKKNQKKLSGGRAHAGDHSTEMCSASEAGSYLRLIDSCITQRKAQGPSRTCDESNEDDDVFPETSARYRAVEPEPWLQPHPEAGSSWPSWPMASHIC